MCRTIQWEYEQERPNRRCSQLEKKGIFHLFYNGEKAAKDQAEMNDYLTILYNDLVNNTREESRMKDYDRFFTVTSTPKGRKVTPKEEAMDETARNYGYFALLSNEVNDPFEALSLS